MPRKLPALRRGLDFIPSPDAKEPGVLIRDPYHYTDQILFVPPPWILGLRFLDGDHTDLDLQEALMRATGQLVYSDAVGQFEEALRGQGFMETDEFYRLRDEKQAEFRERSERLPVHAGVAYPVDAAEARSKFDEYFRTVEEPAALSAAALGVAAPHVSPEGGRNCYAVSYQGLAALPGAKERTFVLLGTSHYGEPEKFGLTRKPFVTPLGTLHVDMEMATWLEQHAGEAVSREDYCFAFEHSIEFQCVFLQYALGSNVKILPILCGPFAESLHSGHAPETNTAVARFFGALQEFAESHSQQLFWILGIDLAHIGRRYGDRFEARADEGAMATIAQLDRERLDALCTGESDKFFDLVKRNGDELKWCGYSPLYTFAKAVPKARGRIMRYEQWNIDPQSVVSFASVEFSARSG